MLKTILFYVMLYNIIKHHEKHSGALVYSDAILACEALNATLPEPQTADALTRLDGIISG